MTFRSALGSNPRWQGDGSVMLWEDMNLGGPAGAGLREVFEAYCKLLHIDVTVERTDPAVRDAARAYADAAINWCRTYVPAGAAICWNGAAEIPQVKGTYQFPVPTDKHIQVIAARIMAHVGPTVRAGLESDSTILQINSITFSKQTVANMHHNCLALGNTFAASYPYDWGAPRPAQRAIMMDYPLIEYDLMVDYKNPQPIPSDPMVPVTANLYTGQIYGDGTTAYKWRPTTPHRVVNAGVSHTYPRLAGDGAAADNTYWRDVWSSHHNSTLTARFKAAERCRQIVFWAVDWQSYVDFETAPSAPVDAGKYLRHAPLRGQDFEDLCTKVRWKSWQQFAFRNPELVLLYNSDMSNVPTGEKIPNSSNRDRQIVRIPGIHGADPWRGNAAIDRGLEPEQVNRFTGRYGADRNANSHLDRGPVPKSVRLHATTVARFNYYDMRVHAMLH